MKITELTADDKNANKGTRRGRETVKHSLEQFGAGRSVLIDRDGRLIAGNKTVEQAAQAGIEDVIIVPTDGTKLVAVQRTDISLDDPKGRGLAVADNRTGELGLAWDAAVMADLASDLDLQPYFTTDELTKLTALAPEDSPAADQSGALKDAYSVLVTCSDEASQLALLERLTDEGYECRSLIS